MGLFDRFKSKKDEKPGSAAAKWAEAAGSKRAQNYDRQEALSALAEMGTAEAASALLKRFTFHMDPSITDQQEKEIAFEGVLKAGAEAIEPVRTFAARAESLAWPMRILRKLLEPEAYIEELVLWLSKWDTEYSKFVDPKIQLLVALEDHKHPSIREAVEPFLEDVNEPARFHAMVTTLAQDDDAAVPAIVQALAAEESFRVKNKTAEGLAARGWIIPEDQRATAKQALPPGFSIDSAGRVQKH
jgi:hypothetical protein